VPAVQLVAAAPTAAWTTQVGANRLNIASTCELCNPPMLMPTAAADVVMFCDATKALLLASMLFGCNRPEL